MYFKRIEPGKTLQQFVECYWIIESNDTTPVKQKIIPDGFPEVVFHYRDPYKININKKWEVQGKALLAGQIKKYFYLENTGASGVFGIKFKPAAPKLLFNLNLDTVTDKAVSLASLKIKALNNFKKNIDFTSHKAMAVSAGKYLERLISNSEINLAEKALALIFKSKGTMAMTEMCKEIFITERQLQRVFKQYVGLSPKLYARIIRFNYIFELIKEGKTSWLDITYHSGYFDQSHFIRDFKSFTGEDPSKYFFNEPSLANFFLKK